MRNFEDQEKPDVQIVMNTTFAFVAASDVGAFAAMFVRVYNAPPWSDDWSVPAATERLRGLAAAPEYEALGADQAGKGFGSALGSGERSANGWVLHLRETFVAPEVQGNGIGRRLLAEFERSLEGRYIGVYLQAAGQAPAHKFYAGSGYADTDLVSMTKRLEACFPSNGRRKERCASFAAPLMADVKRPSSIASRMI